MGCGASSKKDKYAADAESKGASDAPTTSDEKIKVDYTPSEIKKMFADADTDKSGKVSKAEFAKFLKLDTMKAGFKLNASDADNDGKLDFDEFLTAVWLRPTFDEVDKDKSGTLTMEEVGKYLKTHGKNKMAAHFSLMRSDANKDGVLNFEEFKAMVYLRPLFDEADTENAGTVTIKAMTEFLTKKGRPKLLDMLTKADKDGDASIDFEEFETLMSKFQEQQKEDEVVTAPKAEPATEAKTPAAEAPAAEKPAETPSAEVPAEETPAAVVPAAEAPAAEVPAAEAPAAEVPAAEAPAAEVPAAEAPA